MASNGVAINFIENEPTEESCWRSIILMGKNVASYKFALAKSLIELKDNEKTFVSLDELAKPYAKNLCEHLKNAPKQITSRSSKFLDTCSRFNKGEATESELIDTTSKIGFLNVIDAFHVVNREDTPIRFFVDERTTKGGITITDDFYKLSTSNQFANLPQEVEARWKLVEIAWELNINANLIDVSFDLNNSSLYVLKDELGRKDVTSARDALNGYQKGKCFYCFDSISIQKNSPSIGEVDHYIPHSLKNYLKNDYNLDGVWNLVLACKTCNREKHANIPDMKYLYRLNTRNNFLISSHHPLRETLIKQTGPSDTLRGKFLNKCHNDAKEIFCGSPFNPKNEHPLAF